MSSTFSDDMGGMPDAADFDMNAFGDGGEMDGMGGMGGFDNNMPGESASKVAARESLKRERWNKM